MLNLDDNRLINLNKLGTQTISGKHIIISWCSINAFCQIFAVRHMWQIDIYIIYILYLLAHK